MESVKANRHGAVRLWRLFFQKHTQLAVDPKNVDWLVKWGEGFARSMKGHGLPVPPPMFLIIWENLPEMRTSRR
jgi:hypothetical protein